MTRRRSSGVARFLGRLPTASLFRGGPGLRHLILAIPIVFTFAYIGTHYYAPASYNLSFPIPIPGYHPGTKGDPSTNPGGDAGRPDDLAPRDWWIEFFTRLKNTRVDLAPTTLDENAPGDNWKFDTEYKRPELLELSKSHEATFRESHAAFIRQLPAFANHLPYHAATTGIVTTAGAPNFGQAVSLVLMSRQAGSRLPIEIVLDSTAPWVDFVCANQLARLNAKCVYMEKLWADLEPLAVEFERFQWKFVSLIASSFQNILFLDADCFPVRSPDDIFTSEPFTSTGFIAWPDFWTPTSSPLFYKIAGDLEVPPVTVRTSSESGVMIYDKARHADTLLLAAYYNYNGPSHYYTMLSQHGPGEGDKETFFHAALVLDALHRKGDYDPPTRWMRPGVGLKKGYWDVKFMPRAHGRSGKDDTWRGMFMQQMDPREDYRAVMAAMEKARIEEDTEPGPQRAEPRQPRKHPLATSLNTTAYLTDSSFLATVAPLEMDHDLGKYMFFHHNGVKPDFTRILDPDSGILGVGDKDQLIRMWGDPGWIIERTGRDIEKKWWEDSIALYCQKGMEEHAKVCEEMRRVFDEVYK
jgi:alpha 1,2-mannosyltransferase